VLVFQLLESKLIYQRLQKYLIKEHSAYHRKVLRIQALFLLKLKYILNKGIQYYCQDLKDLITYSYAYIQVMWIHAVT
jgi:hypothetical protein